MSSGQKRFRALSAYAVAGRNPEVQVFGAKSSHFPAMESVYSGYFIGFGRDSNVLRTLGYMHGEKSSGAG